VRRFGKVSRAKVELVPVAPVSPIPEFLAREALHVERERPG